MFNKIYNTVKMFWVTSPFICIFNFFNSEDLNSKPSPKYFNMTKKELEQLK